MNEDYDPTLHGLRAATLSSASSAADGGAAVSSAADGGSAASSAADGGVVLAAAGVSSEAAAERGISFESPQSVESFPTGKQRQRFVAADDVRDVP